MNLLAIDTAASVFSVALAAGIDTWYFEADAGPRHSELVMDCIDLLLKKAGLVPTDLSGLACMEGPGSFTGLRIGFSLAKGLALSLGIPVVPIPTLDCMARPFAMWPGLVAPVIDAKKNAFFCALYRNGARLCPPMDAEPAEIARAIANANGANASQNQEPVLLTGPDAAQLYRRFLEESLPMGRLACGPSAGHARALLDTALERIAKNPEMFNNNNDACFSGPVYIRKSDAELNVT
jgi:tRNA threonylcarbamoyladenosine biosynthesis protein TsaB